MLTHHHSWHGASPNMSRLLGKQLLRLTWSKSNGGRLKQTLTTERRLKRRSYTKYLWNSKLNDHHKEAYRFVKDSEVSPQVTSIVEKFDGVLYPCGKRTEGHWTYQLREDQDLFELAGTATIRCKADVASETIFFTPHLQHKGIWTHERKFTKPVPVKFEWIEFDP